ncbi:agamous-like MADS-box protein AGL61 [Magnolia sinica]|uniref:agamous-like MADS-box protein AGL61 n=1 Tax=Magnolia sinica TaxID=86752 RepID=UPI0026595DBC|nr:agamous-like MADS-box protein AGL61 [Magnolia sinica]
MGKRKIPIEKIANKSSLLVSFSKRRQGLFKKASDLCSLTGAHIGILVFSPAGKPFTFGHPSFDSIIDRYVGQCSSSNSNIPSPSSSSADGSSQSVVHLDNLNQRLFNVQNQLDETMEKNGLLKGGNPSRGWWDLDMEGLDVGQLEMYLSELEKLREVVASRATQASSCDEGLEKKEVGFWNVDSHDTKVFSSKQCLEEEVGFWNKLCWEDEVGFLPKLCVEEEAGFSGAQKIIRIGDEDFLV